MKTVDRAWLAGWLEGEGSFTFDPSNNQLLVSASNTDLDVLERVQALAGAGRIYSAVQVHARNKKVWQWHLTGQPAVDLMVELRDLLFVRRQAQVDVALAGYASRRRRGDPRTDIDAATREVIRLEVERGVRGTVARLAREYNINRRTIVRIAESFD